MISGIKADRQEVKIEKRWLVHHAFQRHAIMLAPCLP